MKTRAPSRSRGFTLIELLIAGGLVAVVAAAVALIVGDQKRLFTSNEQTRMLDENARVAINQLTNSIRMAGFGMDPELAVDFENYKCSMYGGGMALNGGKCAAATRESATTTPTTDWDELVLYHRDPNYQTPSQVGLPTKGSSWITTAATASTITLAGPSANLRKGQILLVVCTNGNTYGYVTLGANGVAGGASPTPISLYTSAPAAFQQGTLVGGTSCLSTGGLVFKIDRERYFIASFAGHPYLMLDRGIDVNGDGSVDDKDLIPVAADVADLQVAYEFPQDPGEPTANPPRPAGPLVDATGDADSVLYDSAADAAIAQPKALVQPGGCPDVVVPYYKDRCYFERRRLDPLRYNADSANIQRIRIGLVLRAAQPDTALMNSKKNSQIPALLDRPQVAASANLNNSCPAANWTCDGYRYMTIQFAEETPNLRSRAQFLW